MKLKNVMVAGLLAVAAAACTTQPKHSGYAIEGEIADAQSGTVYLKCYKGGTFVDIDSATVQGGQFSFKGTAEEPLAYGLTTNKASRRPLVLFMGADEQVKVKMNESEKKMEVEGAAENALLQRFQAQTDAGTCTVDSLFNHYSASPVSAYVFLRNFSSRLSYNDIKEARARLAASLNGTEYANQLDALLAKLEKLQDGATAPDFTLPDADGNPVSLSSLRGKYVLIDFWASWCPDCRKENPNVVAAYQRYKDKNFTVLGVSLDKKKEPWLAAIEKDGLTWTHVCDYQFWDGDVVDLYAVKWIPKNFLLDPNGVILASGLEGQALLDKLAEVIK